MNDLQELKSKIKLSSVISRYINLKPYRGEHVGLCPFHNDKRPSLTVSDSKKFYKCFACGAQGDVFDFLKHHANIGIHEAKKVMGEMTFPHVNQKDWGDDPGYTIVKPAYTPPKSTLIHSSFGPPEQVWVYKTNEGEPLSFKCRFKDKKFSTRTLWRHEETHKEKWMWKDLPPPRPLYNLDKLNSDLYATVIVCEGEKAADAINFVAGGCVGITWPNGAESVTRADFAPLYGRNIFLWPDNDDAGRKAMDKVRTILHQHCNIGPDIAAPIGAELTWDAADAKDANLTLKRRSLSRGKER